MYVWEWVCDALDKKHTAVVIVSHHLWDKSRAPTKSTVGEQYSFCANHHVKDRSVKIMPELKRSAGPKRLGKWKSRPLLDSTWEGLVSLLLPSLWLVGRYMAAKVQISFIACFYVSKYNCFFFPKQLIFLYNACQRNKFYSSMRIKFPYPSVNADICDSWVYSHETKAGTKFDAFSVTKCKVMSYYFLKKMLKMAICSWLWSNPNLASQTLLLSVHKKNCLDSCSQPIVSRIFTYRSNQNERRDFLAIEHRSYRAQLGKTAKHKRQPERRWSTFFFPAL